MGAIPTRRRKFGDPKEDFYLRAILGILTLDP